MYKIFVNPKDLTLYVDENKSLLECLTENDLYIKSSCGGHANCTDCVIKIQDGTDNVNEPTFAETQLLGNVFHITKERLACQCFVKGEITVDISNHDKASDEQRRQNKSKKVSSSIRLRKKSEVDEIINERKEKALKKRESRDDATWEKHWEKDPSSRPKKLGGGMRPKKIKEIPEYSDKKEDQE